jgi:membrane-bound lytic murein transglycosylase D
MTTAAQTVARGGLWCLVVLAGLVPGRVGAAADDSEGWIDSTLTAVADRWNAVFDPNGELEYALPTRDDWDQFWTATQLALVSTDDTLLMSMDGDVQASLAWLDQTAGMEPLADWLRQRVDYFEAALDTATPAVGAPPTTTRPPAPRVPPPPRPTVAASRPAPATRVNAGRPSAPRTWPRTVKPREKPEAPAATHALAAKARRVDYWRERLADRKVPAERVGVVPGLKRIFREEGVPADLVWMAEAESTLNPKARSPAGATGLFQFMPATARRFGLKLKPRDERLEPDKSARAAARYLKELNGRYGDWSLALAAYNAGEGTVGKALKRAGGGGFEEVAPHLPSETQMYVPKVMATIELREGRPFRPSV